MIRVPKILLLDTCGSVGHVALAGAGTPNAMVMGKIEIASKAFAADLVPAVSALLQQARLRLADLDAVAVVHGPGSFTGVRIGVSTAKGLVEAAGIPLIAISRLAVLERLSNSTGRTIAILDAGRGEFYVRNHESGQRVRETLMSYEEVLAGALEQSSTPGQSSRIVVCEDRVHAAFAALAPRMLSQPTAADALPLAVERWQTADFDDVLTLDGNYVRRSDSEIFARPAHDIEAKRRGTEGHDPAT